MQHVGASPGRQKCSQFAETSFVNSKEAIATASVAEKNFMGTFARTRCVCRLSRQDSCTFYS